MRCTRQVRWSQNLGQPKTCSERHIPNGSIAVAFLGRHDDDTKSRPATNFRSTQWCWLIAVHKNMRADRDHMWLLCVEHVGARILRVHTNQKSQPQLGQNAFAPSSRKIQSIVVSHWRAENKYIFIFGCAAAQNPLTRSPQHQLAKENTHQKNMTNSPIFGLTRGSAFDVRTSTLLWCVFVLWSICLPGLPVPGASEEVAKYQARCANVTGLPMMAYLVAFFVSPKFYRDATSLNIWEESLFVYSTMIICAARWCNKCVR